MSRLAIIEKLKELEEKKETLEYVLKQTKSIYKSQINIDVNVVTKDFNYQGDRTIVVNETLFTGYLVSEMQSLKKRIDEVVQSLVDYNG